MDLVRHLIIKDPPTKWIKKLKRGKVVNGKTVFQEAYYLTANIFYDGTHWATKSKVVNYAKDWLLLFLTNIPKLERCRLEVIYHSPKDTFDIDNKGYFWVKMILDLMKTPSDNEVKKAFTKGYKIKTINVLQDDTVRYVKGVSMDYQKGQHQLEIKIYGIKKEEQQSLF